MGPTPPKAGHVDEEGPAPPKVGTADEEGPAPHKAGPTDEDSKMHVNLEENINHHLSCSCV